MICDHHLPPGESVPQDAYTVLCPPQDGCEYPNPALAACGVSFKLAQALLSNLPWNSRLSPRCCIPYSRSLQLVRLAMLCRCRRLKIEPSFIWVLSRLWIQVWRIGLAFKRWMWGKIMYVLQIWALNWHLRCVAGRMADPNLVYRLFSATSMEQKLRWLRELNVKQTAPRCSARDGDSIIDKIPDELPNFLVISGTREEGFHKGVGGIVAARLRDKFHRPVAVASCHDEFLTGLFSRLVMCIMAMLSTAARISCWVRSSSVAAGFSLQKSIWRSLRSVSMISLLKRPIWTTHSSASSTSKMYYWWDFFSECAIVHENGTFWRDQYKPLVWLSNVKLLEYKRWKRKFPPAVRKLVDKSMVWCGRTPDSFTAQQSRYACRASFNRYKGHATVRQWSRCSTLRVINAFLSLR